MRTPPRRTVNSDGWPRVGENRIVCVLIPPDGVKEVAKLCMDMLYAIEERSNGELMAADFIQAAKNGTEQLWVVWDPDREGRDRMRAIVGTLIERTGHGERQARIRFCMGEGSSDWWRLVVDTVERWAEDMRCVRLCIFSRPGWSPRLRKAGFRVRHVEHVRDLRG